MPHNVLFMIEKIKMGKNKFSMSYYIISSSYNNRFSKYYTDSKTSENKENQIDSLLFLLNNCLNYFKSVNNKKLILMKIFL